MVVLPGKAASGPVPMPEMNAVPREYWVSGCNMDPGGLVRLTAPSRCPGREGVKVYSTVQVWFTVYWLPTVQVPPVTKLKSLFAAPWVSRLIELRAPAVVMVTVADCGGVL